MISDLERTFLSGYFSEFRKYLTKHGVRYETPKIEPGLYTDNIFKIDSLLLLDPKIGNSDDTDEEI